MESPNEFGLSFFFSASWSKTASLFHRENARAMWPQPAVVR
jgi:hypothetical protein